MFNYSLSLSLSTFSKRVTLYMPYVQNEGLVGSIQREVTRSLETQFVSAMQVVDDSCGSIFVGRYDGNHGDAPQ
jgi:hypothetical protein